MNGAPDRCEPRNSWIERPFKSATQTDKTFKKTRKNELEIRKNTVFTYQ